ncbi:MAG: bifunctional phosphoglucose/phosphomannose isomerase [Flavobacteriales bacterium]|nr:bifunctional phosphoglucose/phosphomannose isomerase [Flavobacteriales bacterium]MCB9205405.1 bifunctional phosphoglucose/phosphomannose isomerase [Flavobacteriales bacterium]
MKELIKDFTNQIAHAIVIGNAYEPSDWNANISNVLISGLGGSGIGGTIAAEVVASEAHVPIVTNNGYFIPNFVSINTLFLACSYSGNTEETISAAKLAHEEGAKIVVISSGGKLKEMADELGWDFIGIPGGQPPRASFGLSFPEVLYGLHAHGIISKKFEKELEAAINLLDDNESAIQEEAKQVTEKLFGKIPVIYAADGFGGVATRFRQQINENSKMLCWHHVIPEMNHNELVGWRDKNEDLAVIIFRNETDFKNIQARMEINKGTFAEYTSTTIEVWSKGTSDLQRALYLIHLGDWVSFFLGEKKGVDITEVKVIDHLKGELAKLS